MNPRLKALLDVRDLLESEGWASPGAAPRVVEEARRQAAGEPRRYGGRFISILCVLSLMTNLALIAALLGSNRPTSAHTARIEFLGFEHNQQGIDAPIYLTADGKEVWRRAFGTGSASTTRPGPEPIDFDAKCVLRLYREADRDGMGPPAFVGERVVRAEDGEKSPVKLRFELPNGAYYQWTASVKSAAALAQTKPSSSRQ